MSYFFNILIIFLLSILTVSFFPYVSFGNTVPLLSFIFLVPLAYLRRGFEPIIIAALAGLFFDLYSAYYFGFYLIFSLILVSLIRVIFYEGMNHITLARFLTITFLAFSLLFIAQTLLLYFSDAHLNLASLVLPFVYLIVINLFSAFIMYLGINWYFDKLRDVEIKGRRG